MQQQTQKPLEKSDFKLLYGMVIIAHIVAAIILKFQLPIIIIACCSVLISFAIAFFKLFKKTLTPKAFCWIWGVVSIFNAIVMSLYLSLFFNKELKFKVLVFIICIIVVAIIGVIMKLVGIHYNKKSYSDTTKSNSPTRTSKLTKTCTALGTVLGIYLIRSGLIPGLTHRHLILGCCIFIFSFFSYFLSATKFESDYDEKNKLY